MDEKLLPCPFCGGEARVIEETRDDNCFRMDGYAVRCEKCDVSTDLYVESDVAISVWNRRAQPDVVRCGECQFWREDEGFFPVCLVRTAKDFRPHRDGYCDMGKAKEDAK